MAASTMSGHRAGAVRPDLHLTAHRTAAQLALRIDGRQLAGYHPVNFRITPQSFGGKTVKHSQQDGQNTQRA